MSSIEPLHFRATLSHYPTGVVVVTAVDQLGQRAEPFSLVAGSFTPVSEEPPVVAVVVDRTAPGLDQLREVPRFCLNFLAAGQEEVFRLVADPEVPGLPVGWSLAPGGSPILDGVVAWAECELQAVRELGDHYAVSGRVTAMNVASPVSPLLSYEGGLGRFTSPSLVVRPDAELGQVSRLAELARDAIEDVADELGLDCTVMAPVGEDAVFVAAASRSREAFEISLGFRVPLVPPLGAVYIVNAGSVAVHEWLARLPEADDDTVARYVEVLQRVKQRGYSLSLRGAHTGREMFETIRDYSDPARTPEQVARFKAVIRDTADLYEPDIDPDATYDVHSIVAPVEDALQQVQIALRLGNLPRGVSGRVVQQWIVRLVKAAEVVSGILIARDTGSTE